ARPVGRRGRRARRAPGRCALARRDPVGRPRSRRRGACRGMRLLLLTHYYGPEFGAPQRRWSAPVQRFIAAGHRVTAAAPVPHYPTGRPTREQSRTHRVGAVERGRHGETVLRTAYLPHHSDIVSRTADHLVVAGDSLRRLLRRFSRPGTRPDVIVATAPAIPT